MLCSVLRQQELRQFYFVNLIYVESVNCAFKMGVWFKGVPLYSDRKPSVDDHSRMDITASSRAQKKRIEHLEHVLRQLNHGQKHEELDPAKVG